MEHDLIVSDPEIMGGAACIRGTRIPVHVIAARITGGESMAELLEDFPYLEPKQIEAAVEYAERVPFEEHPDARPWRKVRSAAE